MRHLSCVNFCPNNGANAMHLGQSRTTPIVPIHAWCLYRVHALHFMIEPIGACTIYFMLWFTTCIWYISSCSTFQACLRNSMVLTQPRYVKCFVVAGDCFYQSIKLIFLEITLVWVLVWVCLLHYAVVGSTPPMRHLLQAVDQLSFAHPQHSNSWTSW